MQRLILNRTRATLPSAALPHACNSPAGGGRGGDRGEVARGDSRRAQANTDLQWKALGSRSRPPPRARGAGGCVGDQHVPAASRPLGSVPFTAAWGRAGHHGGLGYGQDEDGAGLVQGGSLLNTVGWVQSPGWEIPKTPITDSGKISDFPGCTLFYPFPRHPLQAVAGDRMQAWVTLAVPLQLLSLE